MSNYQFSGKYHTTQDVVAECIDIFRRLIPFGTIMASYYNLGVALNFERAESFVFKNLNAKAAIFLEDDLVLGPYYLKTLHKLIDIAIDHERIGYVAAYGNHRASIEEQLQRSSELGIMGHNWAFALTQRQWLKQKPFVDQYLDIVRNADYRSRDHNKIIDLFHSWNLGIPGTSQDIAKSHACISTNTAKINTFCCFGKYIGEKSLHFNEQIFLEMGFKNTNVMTKDVFHLIRPSDHFLDGIILTARESAKVETVVKKKLIGISNVDQAGNISINLQNRVKQLGPVRLLDLKRPRRD